MTAPHTVNLAAIPAPIQGQIRNLAKKTVAKSLSGPELEAEVAEDLLVLRELEKQLTIFDARTLINDAYLEALDVYTAVKQENDKLMSHALMIISHGANQSVILEAAEMYRNIPSADGKDLAERFLSILRQGEIRLEELRETIRNYAWKRGRAFARNPGKIGKMIERDLEALAKTVRYGKMLENAAVRDNLCREYLDCVNFSAQKAIQDQGKIEVTLVRLFSFAQILPASITMKCPRTANFVRGLWSLLWKTNVQVYRAIGCLTMDLALVLSGKLKAKELKARYHNYMTPARQSCVEGGLRVKQELRPFFDKALSKLLIRA